MENTLTILSTLIAVPFIGFFFALTAKDDETTNGRNVFSVTILTLVSSLFLLWRIAVNLKGGQEGLQLKETFHWLQNPHIDIVFGIDIFSVLVIAAVHFAVIIGLVGARHQGYVRKSMHLMTLLFLGMFNGLFVAADIYSFYLFFEALLLPLWLLIGMFGEIRRQPVILRFFIYNFLGALFLFIATAVLYHHEGHNLALDAVSRLQLNRHLELCIWGAIFVSFLSRIPIWPFHYWISAINSAARNPLVFVIANLIPLTGVYGFIRFCPQSVPESVGYYLSLLEIIAIISMLFIALIGLINKDIQYKIFSYATVYYILFLLGALLPIDKILLNIGFSLFAFIIIIAALEVLTTYIDGEQDDKSVSAHGILCRVPRLSLLYSFLVLAAVGMPLSSMFLNNFVILSHLFSYNIRSGILIMLSIVLVAGTLLQELYVFKDNSGITPDTACIMDLSKRMFVGLALVSGLLVVTFVNPLWFMGV